MNTSADSKKITKKSGSNLALSFFCLPLEQRAAMSTFYAFCRVADDIVDEQPLDIKKSQREIHFWQQEIEECYAGKPTTELGNELAQLIEQYKIPRHLFNSILEGVEMDLRHTRYANFEELRKYCYKVASVVGLVSIRIFGCTRPESEEYAVALGIAFQLTNILRDVRHDLREYGRVYLPQDEMEAFGITEEDLRGSSEKCAKLFRLQYFRAKHFYNRARRLIHPDDRPNLSAALVMTEVYEGMLEKIRRKNFSVLEGKISLNPIEKLGAVARARRKKDWHEPLRPPSRAAVWGGGFAGISAALHLTLAGHRAELYEAKSYWGGRAHSFKDPKTGQDIDNGQHIFMGCYHACMEMFDLLGVRDKLREQEHLSLHFCSEKKGLTALRAMKLPFPLHLVSGLVRFKEIGWTDRLSILWMGALIFLGKKPGKEQTVAEWLRGCKQTKGAIRALWEPFCIAALNEPTEKASAELFHHTVRRSIFGSRADSAIYLSKVGLSELLMPEARLFLESVGGKAHLGCGVKEVLFDASKVQFFTTTKGERVAREVYVSTLPWSALRALLPSESALKKSAEKIISSPIMGIYLWTNRPVMKQPVVGLLDSPIQWIFDRSPKANDHQYAVVISAAYDQREQSSRDILAVVLEELNRLFPEMRNVQIRASFVYKSRDATPSARPEMQPYRPKPQTEWENFLLAGDWTTTGLPATLEGAVLSGKRAAEIIG